jgi:two-component system OmpR family response regulator
MPENTQPTILIIEDDPMVADAMSRGLTVAGYHVEQAGGGKTGLKAALELHPDLTILDYRLPGMDGLDVLTELRKDMWGASAKVVFATDVYDVGVVNEVLRLGVTDYVMKADLGLNNLIKLVGKYLPVPNSEARS